MLLFLSFRHADSKQYLNQKLANAAGESSPSDSPSDTQSDTLSDTQSIGDGGGNQITSDDVAASKPPKKKAKITKKASKLAEVYAANVHAKEIFQTSQAKLQAENDRLRKELEDVKKKVVKLENEIDDKSSLLEYTLKRFRQEAHTTPNSFCWQAISR